MAIVSSTYQLDDHYQKDGRIFVTETHVDSVGGEHKAIYRAEPDADFTAIMNARAVQIAEQLATEEFERLING